MKRSYCQICGVSKALDVIGERWTLLIVRDLLIGPSRYGELLSRLTGLTTNLLAKRLRELREAGIVELSEPNLKGSAYQLTAKGATLEDVIFALGAWGFEHAMDIAKDDLLNLRWALLSAKRRLRAQPQDWSIALQTPLASYLLWQKDGAIDVLEGCFPLSDIRLSGPESLLCPIVAFGKTELLAHEAVSVEGERPLLKRIIESTSAV